jgi:hypothetical protein
VVRIEGHAQDIDHAAASFSWAFEKDRVVLRFPSHNLDLKRARNSLHEGDVPTWASVCLVRRMCWTNVRPTPPNPSRTMGIAATEE